MKLELDRDEIDTAVDLLRGVFGASSELPSSLASIEARAHSLEVSRNDAVEDMHYTRATLANIIDSIKTIQCQVASIDKQISAINAEVDSITSIKVMVDSHERCITTINKQVNSMIATR